MDGGIGSSYTLSLSSSWVHFLLNILSKFWTTPPPPPRQISPSRDQHVTLTADLGRVICKEQQSTTDGGYNVSTWCSETSALWRPYRYTMSAYCPPSPPPEIRLL
jgi:hypothetical protein